MRIHNIELTDFRGVTNCAVEFPDSGVTIIEGDNEVGKTSIDEAIRLVLSERDDTTKAAVRELQPVGRDVGPEVKIELSTGPYRLRCTKRFLKKSMTELEVLEPQREQLTGREAHDRLRAVIAETMDESLWEALRMRQGEALTQADLGGGSLGRALDKAAGGTTTVDSDGSDRSGTDDLWQRVVEERQKYFTDTGRPKKHLKESDEAVLSAEQHVNALSEELRSIEADSERVERLTGDAKDLLQRSQRNTVALDELNERARSIADQRRELEGLESAVSEATAAHERAVARADERDALVANVVITADRVAGSETRVASVRERRETNQSALDAATNALESARGALDAAEQMNRCALDDRDHLRRESDLTDLSARRDRVTEAVDRRQEARRVLESNSVDEEALALFDDAHDALVKAEALTSAGSTAVNLQALGNVEVLVDGDPVSLGVDEQRDLSVVETMALEVPGSLRVTLSAGADVQQLARGVTDARRTLGELCEVHGVADVRTARKAAHERREAAKGIKSLDLTIDTELRGSTPEEICAQVDQLVEQVRTYPIERDHQSPIPQSLSSAETLVAETAARVTAARAASETAEHNRDEARTLLGTHEVELAGVEVSLERALLDSESAVVALEQARIVCPDDGLAESVTSCLDALESGQEALRVAKESFEEADAQAVEDRLRNAERLAERLVRETRDNREELVSLRSRLATKGEDGLGGQLDEARSDLVRLTADRDRLHRRADVARLLHDRFAVRREEARRRYVAPLRHGVERLGRIVFGKDFEVELDEDLQVLNRTVGGQTVGYANLSTGAKEQLGMIVRLAAAEIVATDRDHDGHDRDDAHDRSGAGSGAPVVFDDALGWSDPGRLEGMGAVLSTAAHNCQVIVLTCTPGRYESVGNAHVVRL